MISDRDAKKLLLFGKITNPENANEIDMIIADNIYDHIPLVYNIITAVLKRVQQEMRDNQEEAKKNRDLINRILYNYERLSYKLHDELIEK